VLAQMAQPFDAEKAFPELGTLPFRSTCFPLDDFVLLLDRFNTAGDLIPYLEFRHDNARDPLIARYTRRRIRLKESPIRSRTFCRWSGPKLLRKSWNETVRYFRLTASGEVSRSDDWRYSLTIDDMIARIHDRDPSLDWNTRGNPSDLGIISAGLAWLNRQRRIALGKRFMNSVKRRRSTAKITTFPIFKPPVLGG